VSQHDFEIANQGFPSFRSDLNSGLQALASNSAGATEPSATFAYQFWYDETTDLLKLRNSDDDAWITLAAFDQTNDEWEIRSAVIQAVDSAGVTIKNDGGTTLIQAKDDGSVVFRTDDVTIDTSGNFLVGVTSTSIPGIGNTTAGVSIRGGANNSIAVSRDGDIAGYFNRITSDGDIVQFRKDGSPVGSIGVNGGRPFFAADNGVSGSAIQIDSLGTRPLNRDATVSNGVHDLGQPSARWKDLYLSGGVVFGDAGSSGTSTSNTLDSYEEGTFTPVVFGRTTAGTGTYTRQNGYYTKVGNLVRVMVDIVLTNHTGTGAFAISGLPFTSEVTIGNNPTFAITAGNLGFGGQLIAAMDRGADSFGLLSISSGAAASGVAIDAFCEIRSNGTYMTS